MDVLWQVENNIDDMNPQNMEYVFSRILEAHANDVWAVPVMMKKGRMASMLCVLCTEERLDTILEIVFSETTSVGARYFPVQRAICDREIKTVLVDGAELHCKICSYKGCITNISAEYDDCRAAAVRTGKPIKEWQRKVKEEAYAQYGYTISKQD